MQKSEEENRETRAKETQKTVMRKQKRRKGFKIRSEEKEIELRKKL